MNATQVQLMRLDEVVEQVAKGNEENYGCLSGGERIYVAFAANAHHLLVEEQDTMLQAFVRLDNDWRVHLVKTWHSADPSYFNRNEVIDS